MVASAAGCGGGGGDASGTTAVEMRVQRQVGTVTLSNEKGENVTLIEKMRLNAGHNLDTAKEIIRKTVMDDPETNKDRGEDSVHVFVHSLDDSPVILCSRSRVINEKYWQTRYRIFESVYKNFMAEGLEFAYPHMDVHVDQKQY